MINEYTQEKECQYKGEKYSVRDNGTILRHSLPGKKPRPLDNAWTFGKYNSKTGYAEIAGERVHRIVATAFLGDPPSPQYVVDHIDTNRRNNRPENLRWVTKLENIILNPITVKKITMLCGSIEAFLADPSILRSHYVDRDFEWMRAVTKEEAEASLKRLQSWAASDKEFSGGTLGEWIYKRDSRRKIIEIEQTFQSDPDNDKDQNIKPNEIATIATQEQENKPKKIDKSNPFNFPRTVDTVLYKTASELFSIIKSHLELKQNIKLPDIYLQTSDKGILIKESWDEDIIDFSYSINGKSRIPKSITIQGKENKFAIIVKTKTHADENEIIRLTSENFNILELDLSWAKNGVTESEMDYILQTDLTTKDWISHIIIKDAEEKLRLVCEPICEIGRGVAHSYIACPLTSDSVQDIDCWYCHYRTIAKIYIDGELQDCECCFAKSGVKTYDDLLSIIKVEKDDAWITGITYSINGESVTKRFDKFVKVPGDTILNLWEKRTSDSLTVHNIYSDWYVLIENNPKESIAKTGNVYGKLARTIDGLENAVIRSIFSFDDYCWEFIS